MVGVPKISDLKDLKDLNIEQEKGYTVVRRGMVDCKGKGEIETYWVRPPCFLPSDVFS
jgi:hypothetical protein